MADKAGDETPLDGGTAIVRMRDEFLQLVAAYNAIGEYSDAIDAQAMAVMLDKFENDHNVTAMAWPPRIETDEDGPEIVRV